MKKKIAMVAACLLMLLPVFSAFAEDVLTGGSVFISGYYTGQVQEDGTVMITAYSGEEAVLEADLADCSFTARVTGTASGREIARITDSCLSGSES